MKPIGVERSRLPLKKTGETASRVWSVIVPRKANLKTVGALAFGDLATFTLFRLGAERLYQGDILGGIGTSVLGVYGLSVTGLARIMVIEGPTTRT